MFAARYDYDLDKFYSLTLRQVYFLKKIIERRKLEELNQEAKLHNKEVKMPPKQLSLAPEVRKEFDEGAEKLLKRMKDNYRNKQHGNGSRTTHTD